MYNRKGKPIKKALRKAKLDNQTDLAFLFSVFTHVLPDDVPPLLKYLSENVKKGGQIFATFFILNEASKRGIEKGNSHRPFPFPYQNARIDNSEVPEGAVAYEEDDLRGYFADAGLEVEEMSFGNWSGHRNSWHWQDNVVLKV